MRTRLRAAAVVLAVFLASASAAFAGGSTYRGPMHWSCYCDGSSSYSVNWIENYFFKDTSGVSDTMVTLIDNVGYGWHGTVRNTASTQRAVWANWSTAKKGYCKFYGGSAFNGSCMVTT